MERKFIEMLKQDLKRAVAEKNNEEIRRISEILNIQKEQQVYFDKGLTGFSSVDMPI